MNVLVVYGTPKLSIRGYHSPGTVMAYGRASYTGPHFSGKCVEHISRQISMKNRSMGNGLYDIACWF